MTNLIAQHQNQKYILKVYQPNKKFEVLLYMALDGEFEFIERITCSNKKQLNELLADCGF